ncbi:MAG: DUF1513 domain-containing protein [Rhodoferax sp.]|nr:DUF1513 domain-containing protein [Rhodoferax sp.]
MHKRHFLQLGAIGASTSLLPRLASAQTASGGASQSLTLAAGWRGGPDAPGDFVGLLQVDWQAAQVTVKAAVPVPSRAHGLLAEAGGGFLAVAVRPGQWLLRCDADGKVVQRHHMDSETGGRTLDGHACVSADGEWIYTAETQPGSGQGWVSVRERQSLRKVAQWRTHGAEPHHLLVHADGSLMVANGGLLRGEGDKKRDVHLMDSSLVRLDTGSGERLGQWRLKDARLGLRHMAWNEPATSGAGTRRLLGIALQNEHDDLTQRRNSPVLAVWDGDTLRTPSPTAAAGGYSGDIVAGPDGGFVLSCLRSHVALQWRPSAPDEMVTVAQLRDSGALAPWMAEEAGKQRLDQSGVLLAAAAGLARWHPSVAPAVLKWPADMKLDNHWVRT